MGNKHWNSFSVITKAGVCLVEIKLRKRSDQFGMVLHSVMNHPKPWYQCERRTELFKLLTLTQLHTTKKTLKLTQLLLIRLQVLLYRTVDSYHKKNLHNYCWFLLGAFFSFFLLPGWLVKGQEPHFGSCFFIGYKCTGMEYLPTFGLDLW